MKLQTAHYYDDETLEFIGSKFYVDGEEVSLKDYMDFADDLEIEVEQVEENNDDDKLEDVCDCFCDGNCSDCCDECFTECVNEVDDEPEELVCDDDCENCDVPEELCEDICIVEEFANKFEEAECVCPACLRNFIYDVLVTSKTKGWHDHKRALIELLEE